MPKIRYTGNSSPYFPPASTGVTDVFRPGVMLDVSDAQAAALLAIGSFVLQDDQPAQWGDATGQTLVRPDGTTLPVGVFGQRQGIGRRRTGTFLKAGRAGSFTTSASGTTFHTAFAVAQGYDAVRVILAHMNNGGTLAVSSCKVSSVADFSTDSARNNNSGSWSSVTFSGATTGTIPAAAGASRKGYLVSDWINLSSLARTDGGTLPIIAVRVFHNVLSTALTILGINASDNYTNWKTNPSGRVWMSRKHDGDAVGTIGNMASTTDISQTTIAGVQYLARGRVVTILAVGDSLSEGRGTYLGAGPAHVAAGLLTNSSTLAIESATIAEASTSGAAHVNQIKDLFAAGITPDIAVVSPSPNNFSATIAANEIVLDRGYVAQQVAACDQYGVLPVQGNMCPVNPAIKDFNSSDSRRVAYNTEIAAMAARGEVLVDYSATISGATDGDGQVNITAGMTTDGIHPNDAGNAVMGAALAAALAPYIR